MPFDIAENYDQYFASQLYDQRYPRPNPSCLALIMDEMRQQGNRILDFGCGNGRYAAPLLERTDATLVAYDISPEAIRELSQRQTPHIESGRLQPVLGDLAALREAAESGERFDLAIMMFGVLGHIVPRTLAPGSTDDPSRPAAAWRSADSHCAQRRATISQGTGRSPAARSGTR